ncbi:hypothetical protein DENIS_3695 [Desulfonema ishimotonii]|uniref:EF-hand domain-containing protein n=1 Tax=Desulfonema ishimotonii TaxID=45657 RepID=A0A401G0H3_9BACT|nr:EF-hand domain-containing protein [Desulfonema ishimotonii]GBC62718.1 hypothetical protein DENIS_3695 [Desulfonema ishimotonii]
MKQIILFAGLMLTLAANGFADCGADHCGHGKYHKGLSEYGVHWKDLDTSSDDTLSWEEFSARFPGKDRGVFDAIDTDKSGSVSREEWHSFKSAHGYDGGHKKKYHRGDLPDPSGYMVHLPDIDKNGDDALSWDEFKGHFPDTTREVFDAIDLNKDDALDHDEWHQFKAAHGYGQHKND